MIRVFFQFPTGNKGLVFNDIRDIRELLSIAKNNKGFIAGIEEQKHGEDRELFININNVEYLCEY